MPVAAATVIPETTAARAAASYDQSSLPPGRASRAATAWRSPCRWWTQAVARAGVSCHHAHPRYQTPYYDGLVAKMLACGNPEKLGDIEYRCLHCGQGKPLVAMSCKASLCLRCAKVHGDNRVRQVSQVLHAGVLYRHIMLTVPAMFRTTFYPHTAVVLRAVMRSGGQCLDDCYSAVKGKPLQGGSIVVLHTPGRHGQYYPHLHVLAISGGYDAQGALRASAVLALRPAASPVAVAPADQAASDAAARGDRAVGR